MLQNIEAVPDSGEFPQAVDVVVIGAGIVGTAAAYELARKGVRVALFEKGLVGAEQSSRNWGWCRQQNRDHRELPLAMYSLRRWGELGAETGEELGFRRSGIVYATTRQSEIDTWQAWGAKARDFGFTSEILTPSRARELTPGSTTQWLGGVWSHDDGHADPFRASPALARAAQKLGALVHQNCAVRGLDIEAGRISGVWTERGLVRASTVVCAGGTWASLFCRRHGLTLPLAHVNGTAMLTSDAAPGVISTPLYTPTFALRPTIDGAYALSVSGRGRLEITPQLFRHARQFWPGFRNRLPNLKIRIGKSFFRGPEANAHWQMDGESPFERQRILDPAPDHAMVDEALRAIKKEYPAMAALQVVRAWGGLIDSTPDLIPVISPAGPQGLLIAAGFSAHGFGIGPGAGRLVADLVCGDTPIVDPAPFRHARLVDGTELGKPGMI